MKESKFVTILSMPHISGMSVKHSGKVIAMENRSARATIEFIQAIYPQLAAATFQWMKDARRGELYTPEGEEKENKFILFCVSGRKETPRLKLDKFLSKRTRKGGRK